MSARTAAASAREKGRPSERARSNLALPNPFFGSIGKGRMCDLDLAIAHAIVLHDESRSHAISSALCDCEDERLGLDKKPTTYGWRRRRTQQLSMAPLVPCPLHTNGGNRKRALLLHSQLARSVVGLGPRAAQAYLTGNETTAARIRVDDVVDGRRGGR